MKKIFFSLALLCASTLSFADPTAAPTAPTVPANQVKAVYSATYNADCDFGEWGSGTVYTQDTYGKKYVTTGLGYFGICFEGAKALNCASMEKLHLDVWVDANASIRVVPIHGGDEVGVAKSLTGGEWNSIDIALSEFENGTNWTNVFQIKIDQAANLTLWINNIYFYTTVAPAEDTEAPTAFTAVKNAESYFSVKIKANATDASGAVKFTVKNDTAVVGSANAVSGEDAIITVSGLNPNTEYNLSVIASDESGNATEPIAVAAKTLAAPAPAEAPTYAEENVLALFSDIYTNLVFGIQDWWSMPAVSVGNLTADSKALCLDPTGTPAGGCFGLAFAATDITAFDALEMDVYATTANSVLDIQVIGVGTASTKFNLVADQWNHIVLDIKGNTKNNCEQVGFYNCDKLAGFCFVQNVLFVKAAEQGIEDVVTGVKAVKVIENGQLVIIKNGVRYNVQGAEIK